MKLNACLSIRIGAFCFLTQLWKIRFVSQPQRRREMVGFVFCNSVYPAKKTAIHPSFVFCRFGINSVLLFLRDGFVHYLLAVFVQLLHVRRPYYAGPLSVTRTKCMNRDLAHHQWLLREWNVHPLLTSLGSV